MIIFWKAKVESTSGRVSRTLTSVRISKLGDGINVRFNLADGGFFNACSSRFPRLDLGETVTVSIHEDVEVPTTKVEGQG